MTDTTDNTRPRLDVSGAQVVGGALAATTAAVAASTLGVAGTLAGAALGSVVATVGGSLYIYSLRRTSDTVRTVVRRTPAGTEVVHTAPRADGTARDPRRGVRWAPVAGAAAAFALALGGVSAAELVAGEPLAALVSGQPTSAGTTLGSVASDAAAPGPTDPVGTGTPSPTREDTEPSATPTPAVTNGDDGAEQPSRDTEPTPQVVPEDEPTATPEVSPSAEASPESEPSPEPTDAGTAGAAGAAQAAEAAGGTAPPVTPAG